jgi:hypothetical protein
MDFKEFFILSEALGSGELEKAWKDQALWKRALKRIANASYPAAQNASTSMSRKGREGGNMRRYLDGLMGADHWNKVGISDMLRKIKDAGGDHRAVQDEVNNFMLKVARGDFSEEMAADILDRMLHRHLASAEREQDTVNKPSLGIPQPALKPV